MSFRRMILATFLLAVCLPAFAGEEAPEPISLKTDTDRYSYMFGLEVGRSLKQLDMDVSIAAFTRGIEDTLKDREALLSDEEVQQIQKQFMVMMQQRQMQKHAEAAKKNQAEGEKYLAGNKQKEGVITTDSGLQYEVLRKGKGAAPGGTDEVQVHYRGTLLDGTVFDSSYKRGQPTRVAVDGVIPGWSEALKLMKEGGKYRLVIPPDLAYGERGAGAMIGPNAALIFEVELIQIIEPEEDKEPDGKEE